MEEIIGLLQYHEGRTTLVHVYREGNHYADILANFGHTRSFNVTIPDHAPSAIRVSLFEDAIGCATPRVG